MPQPRNGVEWCQPTNANQSQSLIKRGCACPHSSSASPPSLTPPKTALGPDRALLQLGKTWLGPSLCSAQWPSLQQQPQQRHPRWPVRLGGLSQEVCRRGRGRADRAVGRPSCHRALSHSVRVAGCVVWSAVVTVMTTHVGSLLCFSCTVIASDGARSYQCAQCDTTWRSEQQTVLTSQAETTPDAANCSCSGRARGDPKFRKCGPCDYLTVAKKVVSVLEGGRDGDAGRTGAASWGRGEWGCDGRTQRSGVIFTHSSVPPI